MDDPGSTVPPDETRPLSEIDLIRSAFKAVPDAFILYNLQGKPLVWNQAYCRLVECSDEEIRQMMAWDFHPEQDVGHVATAFSRVLESGEPAYIEVNVLTGRGSLVPCGLSGSVLKNGRGDVVGLCGIGRDLTAVKRAEALYEVVMHSSTEGFTLGAADGTFLETNDRFLEMLGLDPAGQRPGNISEVEVSRSREEILEHTGHIISTGGDRFDTQLRKDDGSVIDVDISVTYRDIDGGRLYSFVRDVTRRNQIEEELRQHRDNLEGLVKRRTRELEALNARLRREIAIRKLAEDELRRVNEELEDYAKVVSHELRTPLSGILLALEYLERLATSMSPGAMDQEMSSIVESAKSAVSTTERQVDRLLKLARAGQVPFDVRDVDVGELVRDLLRSMENDLEEKGALCEYDSGLGAVRADPLHLQLIFSNLISNAIKYCDNPAPSVEVRLVDDSPVSGKRYLVRDNGSGLPPGLTGNLDGITVLAKTGLGMPIVGKIVKVYGGTIEAYNDGGACIEFVLHDYPL